MLTRRSAFSYGYTVVNELLLQSGPVNVDSAVSFQLGYG